MNQESIHRDIVKVYNTDVQVSVFGKKDEALRMNSDSTITVGQFEINLEEGKEKEFRRFISSSKFVDYQNRELGPKALFGKKEDGSIVAILSPKLNDKQLFNLAKEEGMVSGDLILNIKSIKENTKDVEYKAPLVKKEEESKEEPEVGVPEKAEAKEEEVSSEEKPKPTRSRRRKKTSKEKKETETDNNV